MPETPAERRRALKKGKRASKRKAPDNKSDDEALKDVRQQGEKVATFLDSLQQTHTQQLAMMGQFMGSIVKGTEREITLIQDYFLVLRDSQPLSCSLFMLRRDETKLWKQMKVVLTVFLL